IPIAVLIFILFAAPSILTESTKRLVNYNSEYNPPAPFSFVLLNKDLRALQQEDYKVTVKIAGNETPKEVFIDFGGNVVKLEKENNITFSYIFKNVQENTKFSLTANGINSRKYELTAIPKPTLVDFKVLLTYPGYLGRKNELVSNTGDLVIPQGTKVNWQFNTRNSDFVSMGFADTVLNLDPSADDKFSYTRRFMSGGGYFVKTGSSLVKPKDSLLYSVNVIPDGFPVIEVSEQKDSVHPKNIYFSGSLKDDYGFSKFNFSYTHYSTDSAGVATEKKEQIVMGVNKTQVAQGFYHYLDLNGFEIKPGDKIEYYFEVWDNDGVNGSKSVKSSVMMFKAPTLDEVNKQASKNSENIEKQMEDAVKSAKDLQKQINEMAKQVQEKKQIGWEEKKKLEDLIKKQQDLKEKVDQIKKENQQNNELKNEFNKPNEQLLEKQKELEKLMENIMTPEMKKLFDELQKMMEKMMDKNKVQEALEKMKTTDKDIEKELDRNLEIFKQMEVEQKLDNVVKKLDEMKKQQEELSKQSEDKKADNKQLEQKQDDLNKKFDELKKDIKEMNEKNKELENPNKLPDTQELEKKTSEDQKNAKDQLSKDDKKGASKDQKKAAEKMEQMEKAMEDAQASMEEQQEGEDMAAMRQLLENLLNLSFAQEELAKKTQKAKIADPDFTKLGQKQQKLKDDAKMVEDSLLAISKRQPKVSASVNREINNIQMNMGKSIAALEERQTGGASNRMQGIMTSINNLALMLNESLEQMQQAAAKKKGGKPGSGSCNKPGGQGEKPSMGSMKKMQEKLNKQMQAMKEAMEKGQKPGGKKPGEKPGQGGMGGTMPSSEQFAKMAAQQEALRKMMQEYMQNQKKDGKNPGGDIADKMEETETELVNKMITQQTLTRQQDILTRLLESEKAEREREIDEKRESNEAREQNKGNQNLFLEYKRMKEKELELLKTVPPSLTPYYKTKVSNYFNNFNK
ncbi:MAG: hypothetical protein IAF38_10605, partial [Bacteroidia bacterium]|nr:hypothetical protein [Bacteroidia bacterium]